MSCPSKKSPVPNPVPRVIDELEPLAPDHRRALDVGVVGHLGRELERPGQRQGEVEVVPELHEVGVHGAARSALGREVGRRQHLSRRAPSQGTRPTPARPPAAAPPAWSSSATSSVGRQRVGGRRPSPGRRPSMPSASRTEALSPVPPMSTARVKGWEGPGPAPRSALPSDPVLRGALRGFCRRRGPGDPGVLEHAHAVHANACSPGPCHAFGSTTQCRRCHATPHRAVPHRTIRLTWPQ